MKVQHLVSNFTGGELSPRLNGRTDVRKYGSGCRVLQNAIVSPHGGARKRPGSRYVMAQKNSTDHVRLVEYIYSTEDCYILMFAPGYIWFFRDQAIVTNSAKNITAITAANPAVVTSAAHGFSNGDRVVIASVGGMTELNNKHYVVAGATTNTFQLTSTDSSSFAAYTSGGTASKIVELATTYTADQLDDLQLSAINDVIYITHSAHPLRKISRLSNTSWVLSTPDISTGPFRTINGDSTNRIRVYTTHRTAITGVSTGTTVVVTAPGHSFIVGNNVLVSGVTAEDGGGEIDTGDPGGGEYPGGAP